MNTNVGPDDVGDPFPHLCYEEVKFQLLQQAVAMVILSKESPLGHYVTDQTAITLSGQQAEVLMNRSRVNYISGPSGSGKSWAAACLYRMYGGENSVYICTTKAFMEYLNYNGCTGTLVRTDEDLLREIKNCTFENKTCVIIDDSHNFACTKLSMKRLFKILDCQKGMFLFVFADNDYQSFDRSKQQAMYDCIHDLTRSVLNLTPMIFPLTEIFRNTRKITSFIQSSIKDASDVHQNITCAHTEDGEGMECIKMSNIWVNKRNNDLVVYLNSLLSPGRYRATDIAILLHPTYSAEAILLCRDILREQIPNIGVQAADMFPRTGAVVDCMDNFLGLESTLCVFIEPQQSMTIKPRRLFDRFFHRQVTMHTIQNPRYKIFLASRATHKAVFVVPAIDADLVQQMKFDCFLVCLRIFILAVDK